MMKTPDKQTPVDLEKLKHGLLVTSLAILTACSGGGGGGDEETGPVSPLNLDNTRWLGDCTSLRSNRGATIYSQVQVAFAGGELIVRNYLYDDENCQVLDQSGTRRTRGSYIELGPTNSGLYTRVDFSIENLGDGSHEAYIPLAQDIYVIEAGLLYFGDPNEVVGDRPVLRKGYSNLRFADNNPGYVFDGRPSANGASTLSDNDAPVEDLDIATELEGNWHHSCNSGRETRLEVMGNRITIHSTFYADQDCTNLQRSDSVEGTFAIGSPLLSASGLELKPLAVDFQMTEDLLFPRPRPEALADNAHFYRDGGTLYLGNRDGVDFNLPYHLE